MEDPPGHTGNTRKKSTHLMIFGYRLQRDDMVIFNCGK